MESALRLIAEPGKNSAQVQPRVGLKTALALFQQTLSLFLVAGG
jgi:hypothetical protein